MFKVTGLFENLKTFIVQFQGVHSTLLLTSGPVRDSWIPGLKGKLFFPKH